MDEDELVLTALSSRCCAAYVGIFGCFGPVSIKEHFDLPCSILFPSWGSGVCPRLRKLSCIFTGAVGKQRSFKPGFLFHLNVWTLTTSWLQHWWAESLSELLFSDKHRFFRERGENHNQTKTQPNKLHTQTTKRKSKCRKHPNKNPSVLSLEKVRHFYYFLRVIVL